MEPVKRTLHPFAASPGVLVPGEQVVVGEEPASVPLAFTVTSKVLRPPVATAREVVERFDLDARLPHVFGDNEAPVTLFTVAANDTLLVLDCYVGNHEYGRWLHDDELDAACQALALPRALVLYRGPLTVEALQHGAQRVSVRPAVERRHPELGRVIFMK